MTIDELHKLWDDKNADDYASRCRRHGDPEHELQVSCVRWFRYQYSNILIWANPMGGRRDKITGAKLKAEGAMAGVPDLTIAAARKGYHGMYIEMKNGKIGRLSPAQKEMIPKLQSEGYKVEVCRSFDEFEKAVKEYLE